MQRQQISRETILASLVHRYGLTFAVFWTVAWVTRNALIYLGVVAHLCNPCTWEPKAGGFAWSSRLAWAT